MSHMSLGPGRDPSPTRPLRSPVLLYLLVTLEWGLAVAGRRYAVVREICRRSADVAAGDFVMASAWLRWHAY